MTSLFRQINRALFERSLDNTSLVAWRIGFAAILEWELYRWMSAGRHEAYARAPFLFPYPGFEWVQALQRPYLDAVFYALALAVAAMGAGLFYRAATAAVWLGFTYIFLLDQASYLNHFYLVCLLSFLMIVVPAQQRFSIDAWRHPELRSATTPAWALWLLRLQLLIVFVWAGLNKINSDWLCGAPLRYWMTARAEHAIFGPLADSAVLLWIFVWGGLLLDLLIVPALLWKRTRWPALVAWFCFHLSNALFFEIGIFPWMMMVAVVLLLPAGLLRGESVERSTPASQLTAPALRTFMAIWLCVQIVLPARHVLWDGWVDWTEEGHNFAWRMKLRGKNGNARFTVTDTTTGQTWAFNADDVLPPPQARKLVGRPDLVRSYAHWVARRYHAAGHDNLTVTAQVMTSLNGREAQLLVDPTVDLSKLNWSWGKADWIMPLHEELRSCGWSVSD